MKIVVPKGTDSMHIQYTRRATLATLEDPAWITGTHSNSHREQSRRKESEYFCNGEMVSSNQWGNSNAHKQNINKYIKRIKHIQYDIHKHTQNETLTYKHKKAHTLTKTHTQIQL